MKDVNYVFVWKKKKKDTNILKCCCALRVLKVSDTGCEARLCNSVYKGKAICSIVSMEKQKGKKKEMSRSSK